MPVSGPRWRRAVLPRAHRRRRGLGRPAVSPVSLQQARACIERGVLKARELGFLVAIAVVDEAGHLIACDRMDGALWVTPEIARAKANAAAGFRASTLDLEERFSKRMLFADNVATLGDYAFVFGRGGVPLVEDGRAAGAAAAGAAAPADNHHATPAAAAAPPLIPRSHCPELVRPIPRRRRHASRAVRGRQEPGARAPAAGDRAVDPGGRHPPDVG